MYLINKIIKFHWYYKLFCKSVDKFMLYKNSEIRKKNNIVEKKKYELNNFTSISSIRGYIGIYTQVKQYHTTRDPLFNSLE